MIIFEGIEKTKDPVCFLVFSNNGKKVTIPVARKIGEMIAHHLRVISKDDLSIKRNNEEEAD